MKHTIVFIGAGNLATHLAMELKKQGNEILQVYSRTVESAKSLADKIGTSFTTSEKDVTNKCDLYTRAASSSFFCLPAPLHSMGAQLKFPQPRYSVRVQHSVSPLALYISAADSTS